MLHSLVRKIQCFTLNKIHNINNTVFMCPFRVFLFGKLAQKNNAECKFGDIVLKFERGFVQCFIMCISTPATATIIYIYISSASVTCNILSNMSTSYL